MLKAEEGVVDGTDLEKSDNNELRCEVCGDQATGRHYGTIACNGCKGFFRRTIRRSYKYTCRFNGTCSIDRHNRAVCRSCRYMRCINAGMRIEAVQNERDVIGKRQRAASTSSNSGPSGGITVTATKVGARRSSFPKQVSTSSAGPNSPPETPPSPSASWSNPKALLESLLASEKAIQRLRDTVIKQTSGLEYAKTEPPAQLGEGDRKATVNDIFSSIHSQLLLVIEWAKTLPPFAALSTEDQTALLKNFACQHVVLCVTYRSKDDTDVLKLLNNACIPRVQAGGDRDPLYPERFYVRDCERMMDDLVAPMRFLRMDDVEFVAMKACILFNPVARGLSSESRTKVLESRRQVFAALQYYVNTKIPSDSNRIGDLTFFILSPLQSLANNVSEDILVSKLAGVAHIDQLMEELILADAEEHKAVAPATSPRSRPRLEKLPPQPVPDEQYTLADCMQWCCSAQPSASGPAHEPVANPFDIPCCANAFPQSPTSGDGTSSSELDLFSGQNDPTTIYQNIFASDRPVYSSSFNAYASTASNY